MSVLTDTAVLLRFYVPLPCMHHPVEIPLTLRRLKLCSHIRLAVCAKCSDAIVKAKVSIKSYQLLHQIQMRCPYICLIIDSGTYLKVVLVSPQAIRLGPFGIYHKYAWNKTDLNCKKFLNYVIAKLIR